MAIAAKFLRTSTQYADKLSMRRERAISPVHTKYNHTSTIDLSAERRRREIIRRLDTIPPLPAAAHEVLSIVAGDPKDTGRLEQTIRHDPALSSQILRVANCAAYYPQTPIDTIHRAVVFLGFSEVRNIALSLSISSVFKGRPRLTGFRTQDFWTHSIATAMISRILAIELDKEEPEIYFTAGLLHDLGRIAMYTCFPDEWGSIVAYAQENGCPLLVAERKFGLQHNLIGAWLAKNWELPSIYQKTIATHHLRLSHPKIGEQGLLIQLADQICHHVGMGLMSPPAVNRRALANAVGLGQDTLEILEEQLDQIEELASSIIDILH